MTGDVPQIFTSTYAANTVPMGSLSAGMGVASSNQLARHLYSGSHQWHGSEYEKDDDPFRRIKFLQQQQIAIQTNKEKDTMARKLRIVQVFIADTDENIPLEKAILFKGEQKLTDSTDQELFFEIDIKTILDDFNKFRVTVINKKVKERTEYLEPVKIRDLKMTVVNIAEF